MEQSISESDQELCIKFPFMEKCKVFVEGMDAKHLDKLDPQIIERAFERITQAMESGIVSRHKIPKVITKDELAFHESCLGSPESWNIIFPVLNGKIKVV